MTLRTAVVGGGAPADGHLDGLRQLATTDLVAVCDRNEQRVRERARAYDLTAYTDAEAMLAREDLDWVHVCTPVGTRFELARLAVETGVPVHVDAPVTRTAAEAEALADAATDEGVPVSVGHDHVFTPAMRTARTAVERGVVGPVRSVDVFYAGETWPDDPHRGGAVEDFPGGAFESALPHPIYVALSLGGYPPDAEAVDAGSHRHRRYDGRYDFDGVQFQYTSESGVLCHGTAVASDVPHKEVRIHGDRGSIVADLVSQTVTRLDRDYEASIVARAFASLDHVLDRIRGSIRNASAVIRRKRTGDWASQRDLDARYYQFEREARALLDGNPMAAPVEEGLWTVRIAEGIRQSGPSDSQDTVGVRVDRD